MNRKQRRQAERERELLEDLKSRPDVNTWTHLTPESREFAKRVEQLQIDIHRHMIRIGGGDKDCGASKDPHAAAMDVALCDIMCHLEENKPVEMFHKAMMSVPMTIVPDTDFSPEDN